MWVVIHLSQVQMSQCMPVCLTGINLYFFENFSGYEVTNSNLSTYHIRYSTASNNNNVLCTSGIAIEKYISIVSKL